MNSDKLAEFKRIVWHYYGQHGRHTLPWRLPKSNGLFDPYEIYISEIMLQQTQVSRVVPKFEAFIKRFPTVQDLARSSLAEVLNVWSGLGYNRRAKFAREVAQAIVQEFDGHFPTDIEKLVKLPGIGHNTAAAILTYAFNVPVIFVETNIRTAFIDYFFEEDQIVHDKELLPLLTTTLDNDNPREWYWALMDYGAWLKRTKGNSTRRSAHYTKQSRFEGSLRQLRSSILKSLLEQDWMRDEISQVVTDRRLEEALSSLQNDGLIKITSGKITLAD